MDGNGGGAESGERGVDTGGFFHKPSEFFHTTQERFPHQGANVSHSASEELGSPLLSPAREAYEEVVRDHAERLHALVEMLLGDRAATEAVLMEAFRLAWERLDRGTILGDLEETVYRAALQRAVRRASRSPQLRGTLPATTADDRQITAFGIIQQFVPEHRAAALAVLWSGLSYRAASMATGVAVDRVRDVVFGARQEFRAAYGMEPDAPACRDVVPSLSLRADGQIEGEALERTEAHLASCESCRQAAAAFAEFGEAVRQLRPAAPTADFREQVLAIPDRTSRPTGIRRVLNLALGPFVLVVVLGLGLLLLQQCEEPSIKTGVGRTSDLVYAIGAGDGIVILDSGTGRELGRLPLAGVIGSGGREAFGSAPGCGPTGQGTSVRAVDAATLQVREVLCVERPVTVLGADDRRGRLLLGDDQGNVEQLLILDLRRARITAAQPADPSLTGVYSRRLAISPDGAAAFSVTAVAEPGQARFAVAETDLETLEIAGLAELTNPCGMDAVLLAVGADEVYAYQPACGRLWELHPRSGRPSRRIELGEGGAPETGHAVLAVSTAGNLLYAVAPGDGIAIIDRSRLVELRRLSPERPPISIAASTDGGMLYTISRDGSYAVLDAGSGRVLLRRQSVGPLTILQVNAGE